MSQGRSIWLARGIPIFLLAPVAVLLAFQYNQDVALLRADADLTATDSPQLTASDRSIPETPLPLFGIPSATDALQPETLPETRLELELRGTFTHIDAGQASALIAERNGNAKQMFVGEPVAEDAILIRVDKGFVTLRRNGQDEILRLSTFGTPEQSAANQYTQRSASISPTVDETPQVASGTPVPGVEEPRASSGETLRERLARLRAASETE